MNWMSIQHMPYGVAKGIFGSSFSRRPVRRARHLRSQMKRLSKGKWF